MYYISPKWKARGLEATFTVHEPTSLKAKYLPIRNSMQYVIKVFQKFDLRTTQFTNYNYQCASLAGLKTTFRPIAPKVIRKHSLYQFLKRLYRSMGNPVIVSKNAHVISISTRIRCTWKSKHSIKMFVVPETGMYCTNKQCNYCEKFGNNQHWPIQLLETILHRAIHRDSK